jgi:hypothetical protein
MPTAFGHHTKRKILMYLKMYKDEQQRCYQTCLICHTKNALDRLKYRRLRGDMIETYKITVGKYDTRVTKQLFEIVPSSTTRGHHLKILKKRTNLDTRIFTNRIVEQLASICNQC